MCPKVSSHPHPYILPRSTATEFLAKPRRDATRREQQHTYNATAACLDFFTRCVSQSKHWCSKLSPGIHFASSREGKPFDPRAWGKVRVSANGARGRQRLIYLCWVSKCGASRRSSVKALGLAPEAKPDLVFPKKGPFCSTRRVEFRWDATGQEIRCREPSPIGRDVDFEFIDSQARSTDSFSVWVSGRGAWG